MWANVRVRVAYLWAIHPVCVPHYVREKPPDARTRETASKWHKLERHELDLRRSGHSRAQIRVLPVICIHWSQSSAQVDSPRVLRDYVFAVYTDPSLVTGRSSPNVFWVCERSAEPDRARDKFHDEIQLRSSLEISGGMVPPLKLAPLSWHDRSRKPALSDRYTSFLWNSRETMGLSFRDERCRRI